MLVAVLPYGTPLKDGLASVPTSKLRIMEGSLLGEQVVADLGSTDHLICYPDSRLIFRFHPQVRCNLSIVIAEPRGIHTKFYRSLRWTWWRYFRIFTYDEYLLRTLPNARFLPFGTTWVETHRNFAKTRRMSLIASEKRMIEGHQLRHDMVAWIRARGLSVDILGRGYQPFDRKEDGLGPYRFSVIIENSRQPGYFTEKLLDAFFCDTVPIYWGDPMIGRFFDVRGMVICDTKEKLQTAIDTMTDADYRKYSPYMKSNRTAALQFVDYERNAADIVSAFD